MRLEIYDDAAPEPESVVRLRLVSTAGVISVHAVDANGETKPAGRILVFRGDGTISRTESVGEDLGFQLDESRRVKFY